MEKIKIISLYGFLGLPADWDLIRSYLMVSPLAHQFEWWSVDYMNTPGLDTECDFTAWAKNFNNSVQQKFAVGPRILLGYSLGGRLALHALKRNPELYDQAIFISTNPGLQSEKDKEERAKTDQRWSEQFLKTPWAELMSTWNAQAVFKDSLSEPLRLEAAYDREKLARALVEWSLARQEDFQEFILQRGSQILWACGEKDIKFASQAMELQRSSSQLRAEIFPRASHRVLFDQPHDLAQKIISFLIS
ncbi:MAG TPA: alpha/beta fold hydrolase [Pseudobdellovibrionaceae bacterium]